MSEIRRTGSEDECGLGYLLDGEDRTWACQLCDFETNHPVMHNGRIICERCLNDLLDVQQSIEADRQADVDEEDACNGHDY